VTTYYLFVSGWVVAGLALLGRWVLRLLAAPSFFGAYKALPWVALGWAMYGLWVVFLVIAGRAKVTTRNFPASIAGLAANVILLLVLVPPLGLAGAGLALCGAYVVMLSLMYLLTRRAFAVQFEWLRLGQLVVIVGGLAAAGDLALPTSGVIGFLSRAAVAAAIPLVLLGTGFLHPAELRQGRALLRRARAAYPRPARSES
jgi:O-antigen/teichoic acid export membrane protein